MSGNFRSNLGIEDGLGALYRRCWKQKNRIKCGFVPTTGVEPARPFEHYPLKVACLPIPPRGRSGIALKNVSANIGKN